MNKKRPGSAIILERFAYNPESTLGTLTFDDKTFVTVEPPWLDNQRNVSCVPEGFYTCKRYSSKRYPSTFEITNVEDRSYIVFHAGNTAKDSEGCIILGTMLGGGQNVLNSKKAMAEFMSDMEDVNSFELQIKQYRPFCSSKSML